MRLSNINRMIKISDVVGLEWRDEHVCVRHRSHYCRAFDNFINFMYLMKLEKYWIASGFNSRHFLSVFSRLAAFGRRGFDISSRSLVLRIVFRGSVFTQASYDNKNKAFAIDVSSDCFCLSSRSRFYLDPLSDSQLQSPLHSFCFVRFCGFAQDSGLSSLVAKAGVLCCWERAQP